jgi:plasmid maintenance system antidote protein VapI
VITVRLSAILNEKKISTYQCSRQSSIPYTTLLELVKGKTSIEKCSAETVFRLAKALDMTMDELYTQLHSSEARAAFETFKSNVCHAVKEKGDLDFIIDTLRGDEVGKYWERQWYPEAYYTLAMLDYLSRENDLPICSNYESIRQTSLKKPVFPRDIELAARIDPSLDVKAQAVRESIPEFIRFNIVEKDVRNVC